MSPRYINTLYDALASAMSEVAHILMGDAKSKGYTGLTDGDGRPTLDFVAKHAPGHAEGEMIYKVLRWQAKRDPKDLLKIMAWAFLIWDSHNRAMVGQGVMYRGDENLGGMAAAPADVTGLAPRNIEEAAALERKRSVEPAVSRAALWDLLERAWGVIANASGGSWGKETIQWQDAAAGWRDQWQSFMKQDRSWTSPAAMGHAMAAEADKIRDTQAKQETAAPTPGYSEFPPASLSYQDVLSVIRHLLDTVYLSDVDTLLLMEVVRGRHRG